MIDGLASDLADLPSPRTRARGQAQVPLLTREVLHGLPGAHVPRDAALLRGQPALRRAVLPALPRARAHAAPGLGRGERDSAHSYSDFLSTIQVAGAAAPHLQCWLCQSIFGYVCHFFVYAVCDFETGISTRI